jgi:hypothetical protein
MAPSILKAFKPIGKAICLYDASGKLEKAMEGTGSTILLQSDEVAYMNNHYEEILEAATFVTEDTNRILTPKVEGLMYILLARVNKAEAIKFLKSVSTGSNLPEDHPVMTLRKRILDATAKTKKKWQKVSVKEAAIFVAKTWNAVRNYKPLGVLRYIKGENVKIHGLVARKKETELYYSSSDTSAKIKSLQKRANQPEPKPKGGDGNGNGNGNGNDDDDNGAGAMAAFA